MSKITIYPETQKPTIQICATDKDTGESFDIDDLYWFEENGVHDWSGDAHHGNYLLEVYVDGIKVFPR